MTIAKKILWKQILNILIIIALRKVLQKFLFYKMRGLQQYCMSLRPLKILKIDLRDSSSIYRRLKYNI